MSKRLTYEHMAIVQQERAKGIGLRLENYNAGVARSDTSGWRVFRGIARRDYFEGSHLAHYRDGSGVVAFLDGCESALRGAITP